LFAPVGVRIAGVNACEKIQRNGARKFRRDAEAAFMRVVAAGDLLISSVERFSTEALARISDPGYRLFERGDDLRSLFGNFFTVLFPGGGDSSEDFGEAGLAPAIFRRKISSADERLKLRRQPDAHWPSAA